MASVNLSSHADWFGIGKQIMNEHLNEVSKIPLTPPSMY